MIHLSERMICVHCTGGHAQMINLHSFDDPEQNNFPLLPLRVAMQLYEMCRSAPLTPVFLLVAGERAVVHRC